MYAPKSKYALNSLVHLKTRAYGITQSEPHYTYDITKTKVDLTK